MIRMLIVGYCFAIRSERRLCEEVHLNLAYRWFCRLGLDGGVPDHSTFSKNRHGRFRESGLLRRVFEIVLQRCMAAGLVGGEGFAVDASLISADANRALGGTGAHRGPAFYAYSINYLVDVEHAVIVDVEGSGPIRQAEMEAAKRMVDRAQERHDLKPRKLIADTAYGAAETLKWLVDEKGIEPHIPVFDKSDRQDGTFSRSDFIYEPEQDRYVCPAGKHLRQFHTLGRAAKAKPTRDGLLRYRARKTDCEQCPLRQRCTPNMPIRRILRSVHEEVRDVARRIAATEEYERSRRQRKKVEMAFAHLKRILKLDRLRLRGPRGVNDEFLLAATAQNLRKMARLMPA
jgi:IS5 family transposase